MQEECLSPLVASLDFLGVEKKATMWGVSKCGRYSQNEGGISNPFCGTAHCSARNACGHVRVTPWQEGSEVNIQSAGMKTLSLLHGCTWPFCF